MTREQELDEFLELFAIRPYDRARENLIALIDSATREARIEQIDLMDSLMEDSGYDWLAVRDLARKLQEQSGERDDK